MNRYTNGKSTGVAELEDEWESHEAHYSNPEFEDEWESHETHYSHPYSSPEMEADQFFPLIAKLGAKLLPKIGKLAVKGVKRLIPRARRMIPNVVKNIQRTTSGQEGPPSRLQTARELVEQLRNVLSEGESEVSGLEAALFGANEFESELANHEIAHEMALTEVLAAEAAHTESEAEAAALLGAALPVTLRVMRGGTTLRPLVPALVQANARLVRSLHRQGVEGRQLLRIVSTIHRRTIASLRIIARRGQRITPSMVSRIMAAHTARVLGTPQILGRALIRNTAIRRGTVVQPGQFRRSA
jgi:hypothetical protein